MRARVRQHLVVFIATVAVAACGSSAEPTQPVLPALTGPSFSISMRGDVRATFQGVPTSIRSASGYREVDASGVGETTAVALVSLKPSDGSQPSVTIGLMGPIQPGTYTLRSVGSAVPGSKPEYYGVLTQRGADGTRNFTATSGTVTLTSAGDTLRGTLALHYGSVVLVPTNAPAGAKYQAAGASVDATGTFVVAAPTFTVP